MPPASTTSTLGALNGLCGSELRLPVEIIESIINEVDDECVLKACALSCSHLRKSCQSRLFQDFAINCDHDDGSFKEGGIVHTVAFDRAGTHTNFMSLLRRLKIQDQYGPWGTQGGRNGVYLMLGVFLKKLTAVEKLEFRGAGLEWSHWELVDGLMTVLQIPTLKELRLVSLEGFPMSLVLWGRALKRVEFERVAFVQTGIPAGLKKQMVVPTLEEFRADNRGMGLTLLGVHFLSCTIGQSAFTKLKKLRLEYRDSEGDRPEDINRLLTVCQSSLEDLALFFTHDAYRSTELYARNVSLGRLTNLRSFSTRLYITTQDGYLEEENPFKLLKILFRGCPASLAKIQLSFFHRFGDAGDERIPEVSGWSDLDNVLTSISGLEEVSVVICCTQCTPGQMAAHEGTYDLPLLRSKGISLRTRFTDSINLALEG